MYHIDIDSIPKWEDIQALPLEELVEDVNDEYTQMLNMLKASLPILQPGEILIPRKKLILRAFQRPEHVKVILLGQDPYPNNLASGLAFSYDGPIEHKGPGVSMHNIAKEVYRSRGEVMPVSLSANLSHWTDQGVMLVNAALTTVQGTSGAHQDNWSMPVARSMFYYTTANPKIVFVAFGRKAEQVLKKANIPKRNRLFAYHPASWSSKFTMIGSDIFLKVNELLDEPIDWRLNSL